MPDKWNADTVATLLEKSTQLVVQLVRIFKTPDRVLRKITDLTQRLRAGEADIDAQIDDLYDDNKEDES